MKIAKWLVTALVIVLCVVAVKFAKRAALKKVYSKPKPVAFGARIKGAMDAPLRIEEFTDFQCPSCAKVVPVVDELLKKYSGKISIEHKYYPLPSHKNSMKASLYAECSSAQGKFWPYHDLLFSKQDNWSKLEDPTQYFDDLALLVNEDLGKLKSCLSGKEATQRIDTDKLDGEIAGIKATPTFVIERKLFVGGENLKTELESRFGQ